MARPKHDPNPDMPDGDGDCFESAVNRLLDISLQRKDEIDEWFVCHGIATGTGPVAGIEFPHGWLERGEKDSNYNSVYDYSNGNRLEGMPSPIYYAIGNLDHRRVKRYSIQDVRRLITKYKHYGPWERLG